MIISINNSSKKKSIYDEDCFGYWVSPTAIDLQINGGLAIVFLDLTFNEIPKSLKLQGSILPLLEACMKIADWVYDPSAATWMAKISPRMVLAEKKIMAKPLLIGKNIKRLLRWKMNSCNQ